MFHVEQLLRREVLGTLCGVARTAFFAVKLPCRLDIYRISGGFLVGCEARSEPEPRFNLDVRGFIRESTAQDVC
jgi:hypothetical protein